MASIPVGSWLSELEKCAGKVYVALGKAMKNVLVLAAFFTIIGVARADIDSDSEYKVFRDARYMPHSANDGDSFYILVNGTSYLVRLYGVDCPETRADGDIYMRRVREQTRWFGLDSPWRTVQFGLRAQETTRALLSEPFVVHMMFTPALGNSPNGRTYAFVTLADGRDLGETLVKMGMARAHGVTRQTPSGDRRSEYAAHLQDCEIFAAMQRVGIWAASDPERLVAMRAEARREQTEASLWRAKLPESSQAHGEIDINTASEKELQLLVGIGPTLARRIVEGRPYHAIEDLERITGISKRLVEQFRPFVRIKTPTTDQLN